MKLLNRNQIENLAQFRSENYLTTSFYLNTDKGRLTKKEIQISLKNLLGKNRDFVDQMDISREKKNSLHKDLDSISRFVSQNISSYNYPGLAIFSSSGDKFWEVFNLPDSPQNRIIFDHNAYVRPLSALLGEYHCICTLLIDRREAKWCEVSMGEISVLQNLIGEVPRKVKEGGWEGYESKRIERHIASMLHEHFKNIAQATFRLFKENQFDWLFLGCSDEHYAEFEPLLHPYLKEKLKGRIKAKPGDSPKKILQESLELEKNLKKEREETAVHDLISELKKGGLAISGIKDTLRKLNLGEVQTLVVMRYFSQPGTLCPKCGFLFVDELRCPSCQVKTEKVVDVIDEAVEAALDKNCSLQHILPPSKLSRYGNIGAFLRYKI